MRYPQIGKQPTRTVSVPQLSGGLNLRDSVSMVADNQLTESLNMWFKDGVLKTRPGLIGDNNSYEYPDISGIFENCEIKTFSYVKKANGDILALLESNYTETGYGVVEPTNHFFFWMGNNNIEEVGNISQVCSIQFVVEHKGMLYAFTNIGIIYRYTHGIGWECDEWVDEATEHVNKCWKSDGKGVYIPTVATNCKSCAVGGGNMLEPYNLISPFYKMIFSTVDDKDNTAGNEMKYSLLNSLEDDDEENSWFEGSEIKAEIAYSNNSSAVHTAVINHLGHAYEDGYNDIDGLRMEIADGITVMFYKPVRNEKGELTYDTNGNVVENIAIVGPNDYRENNMTITAPGFGDKSRNSERKVFSMTRSVWFGGAAGGINGGGRLFLCGNENRDEKSLLVWSSLNNPLYFPENNYAYVGSASSKLCTFGKQDETLVLFKENETYYTYYVQNNDITAEQLFNQSVVDYESSSVYFPVIQLNDSIGCDCPDSVQLCRNRLVWAHSNGKVYSLVTQSQYNERNIFEISEMIRPELRKLSGSLQNAISADWEEYYVLALGNKLYLMDYNSYGYQYIYSYSKAEDANVKIPWYIWETPENKSALKSFIFGSSDNIGVMSCFGANGGIRLGATYFDISNSADCDFKWEFNSDNSDIVINHTGPKIPCRAQTKIFDFSAPNIRKNIKSVGLSVGNNGGTPINVKFITDCGTEEDVIVLDGADTKERTAGFLDSRILYPCIKSVLRFGVEFSCEGLMAIEGINLSYRYLGGAR